MPPPKKAAKKAAKKTADHHHVKHHEANDMRRAYEHMGRLEVLQGLLKPAAAKTIVELSKLAHDAIGGGHNKEAADLLRASEHLSFALLGGDHTFGGNVSSVLERAITEHFDELMRRADKHWNEEKRSGIHRSL